MPSPFLRRYAIAASVALALGALLPRSAAQAPTADANAELTRRRDAKLAEDWLRRAPWRTDFDAARAEAKRERKTIFAYFTRSYEPCAPCKALETGLLSEPEFASWAEGHVLLVHVTSRIFTDPHHDLFADRGGVGYPYLAFLDDRGDLLAVHAGANAVEALRATAAEAAERLALRDRAAGGDEAAAVRLFLERLELEGFSFAEASAARAAIGDRLSAEQDQRARQLIVNREIHAALEQLRRKYPQQGGQFLKEVGAQTVAFFRAGKAPTNSLAPHFYAALFAAAEAKRDRALFAAGLERLEQTLGKDPAYARTIERQRRVLQGWKEN